MEDFTSTLPSSSHTPGNTSNNFDNTSVSNSNITFTSSVLPASQQYQTSHHQTVPYDVYHSQTSLYDHTHFQYPDNSNVHTNSPQTFHEGSSGAFLDSFSGSHPNSEYLFRTQRKMLLSMGILDPDDGSPPTSPLGTLQDVPTRPIRVPVFDKREYKSRFVLLRQPDALQRRSYPKERRYIFPKPLIVCARETVEDTKNRDLPRILEGTVTVELALYEADNMDNNNPQKLFYLPHLLECTDGKSKRIVDNTAQFELTVTGNSGLDKFLLVFAVTYLTENGVLEEFVLSTPFSVLANASKTKNTVERAPTVRALQPTEGPSNSETEVWIKGSEFNSPVVTFAENLARVISVEDNLLTVMAPKFPGLQEDTPVLVTVSNTYPQHSLTSSTRPLFTYYVGDNITHMRSVASQNQKNLNEVWHNAVT